ncbi:MAG: hypothetical protein ACI4QN_03975 [Candidatus Coproplasma sp.]
MEEKFNYTYSAPTEEERKEIESIRKSYLPQSENKSKLQRLIELDKKVKNSARIVALSFGIVGVLVFGLGMSMAMVWELYIWGAVVGLVGVALTAAAYPLMRFTYNKQKQKYSQEILRLSEELLNN